MTQEDGAPQSETRSTFLRVLGIVWLVVMVLTLGGAALAPYLGAMTDTLLHQTLYRQWTRLTLEAEQSFFDLSTPPQVLRSYYSALYHGDATRMAQLTAGDLRDQMRQRVAATTTAPAFTPYQSFLLTETRGEDIAVVLEKLHLFWGNGLRFVLQREATQWRIVSVAPIPLN